MNDTVVNILILRHVNPGQREAFESAVRAWIPRAVRYPGHLGVFMLKPPPGADQYGALLRFSDTKAWEAFSEWEEYRAFLNTIRTMLTSEPSTEVLHGMEAWFLPPTTSPSTSPKRWKMAVLTYLGVCAMVFVASQGVRTLFPGLSHWTTYFLVNAIVVAGLTWCVMPLLVRLCKAWIFDGKPMP